MKRLFETVTNADNMFAIVRGKNPHGEYEVRLSEYVDTRNGKRIGFCVSDAYFTNDLEDACHTACAMIEAPALDPVPCAWWASCENDSTHTRAHPILGDVPICDRCEEKLKRIG